MDALAPRAVGRRQRDLLTLTLERASSQQAPRPLVSLGERGSEAFDRSSKVVNTASAAPMTILAPWMHLHHARWAGGGEMSSL